MSSLPPPFYFFCWCYRQRNDSLHNFLLPKERNISSFQYLDLFTMRISKKDITGRRFVFSTSKKLSKNVEISRVHDHHFNYIAFNFSNFCLCNCKISICVLLLPEKLRIRKISQSIFMSLS